MTEEKVRVMQSENELTIARFEGRGRGHAPRNAGGLQKPEKTGNGGFFSLEPPERNAAADTKISLRRDPYQTSDLKNYTILKLCWLRPLIL